MANSFTAGDVGRAVRRYWYVVLVTLLVCTTAGYVARAEVLVSTYEASALFRVDPVESLDGTTDSPLTMETERVVATSTVLLTEVANDLPGWDALRVRDALQVSVPEDSQILEFTARTSSPESAAQIANLAVEAYRDNREEALDRARDAREASYQNQVADVNARLATLPKGSAEVERLRQLKADLLVQRLTARSEPSDPGEIVSAATAPQSSVTPGTPVFVAAGMTAGLLLGLLLALMLARAGSNRSAARLSTVRSPGVAASRGPYRSSVTRQLLDIDESEDT